MIVKVGNFDFVLTPVPDSDRVVIVIRRNDGSELCIDAAKASALRLADAIQALAK